MKTTRKRAWVVGVSITGIVLACASAAADFNLTGTYEGLYVCDSVTAGVPSTWGRPVAVGIVQQGTALRVDLAYTDVDELGREFTVYRGEVSEAQDRSFVTGYFSSCGGTFPARELVRLFPAATNASDFQFAADGVWVSSDVPNIPGLTVQSCKWSLRRISTGTPSIRPCDAQD